MLLLLAGGIEPSQAWFITLAVLSGIELLLCRRSFGISRRVRGWFAWPRRWEYDW